MMLSHPRCEDRDIISCSALTSMYFAIYDAMAYEEEVNVLAGGGYNWYIETRHLARSSTNETGELTLYEASRSIYVVCPSRSHLVLGLVHAIRSTHACMYMYTHYVSLLATMVYIQQ